MSDAELGKMIREMTAEGYLVMVKFGPPPDGV